MALVPQVSAFSGAQGRNVADASRMLDSFCQFTGSTASFYGWTESRNIYRAGSLCLRFEAGIDARAVVLANCYNSAATTSRAGMSAARLLLSAHPSSPVVPALATVVLTEDSSFSCTELAKAVLRSMSKGDSVELAPFKNANEQLMSCPAMTKTSASVLSVTPTAGASSKQCGVSSVTSAGVDLDLSKFGLGDAKASFPAASVVQQCTKDGMRLLVDGSPDMGGRRLQSGAGTIDLSKKYGIVLSQTTVTAQVIVDVSKVQSGSTSVSGTVSGAATFKGMSGIGNVAFSSDGIDSVTFVAQGVSVNVGVVSATVDVTVALPCSAASGGFGSADISGSGLQKTGAFSGSALEATFNCVSGAWTFKGQVSDVRSHAMDLVAPVADLTVSASSYSGTLTGAFNSNGQVVDGRVSFQSPTSSSTQVGALRTLAFRDFSYSPHVWYSAPCSGSQTGTASVVISPSTSEFSAAEPISVSGALDFLCAPQPSDVTVHRARVSGNGPWQLGPLSLASLSGELTGAKAAGSSTSAALTWSGSLTGQAVWKMPAGADMSVATTVTLDGTTGASFSGRLSYVAESDQTATPSARVSFAGATVDFVSGALSGTADVDVNFGAAASLVRATALTTTVHSDAKADGEAVISASGAVTGPVTIVPGTSHATTLSGVTLTVTARLNGCSKLAWDLALEGTGMLNGVSRTFKLVAAAGGAAKVYVVQEATVTESFGSMTTAVDVPFPCAGAVAGEGVASSTLTLGGATVGLSGSASAVCTAAADGAVTAHMTSLPFTFNAVALPAGTVSLTSSLTGSLVFPGFHYDGMPASAAVSLLPGAVPALTVTLSRKDVAHEAGMLTITDSLSFTPPCDAIASSVDATGTATVELSAPVGVSPSRVSFSTSVSYYCTGPIAYVLNATNAPAFSMNRSTTLQPGANVVFTQKRLQGKADPNGWSVTVAGQTASTVAGEQVLLNVMGTAQLPSAFKVTYPPTNFVVGASGSMTSISGGGARRLTTTSVAAGGFSLELSGTIPDPCLTSASFSGTLTLPIENGPAGDTVVSVAAVHSCIPYPEATTVWDVSGSLGSFTFFPGTSNELAVTSASVNLQVTRPENFTTTSWLAEVTGDSVYRGYDAQFATQFSDAGDVKYLHLTISKTFTAGFMTVATNLAVAYPCITEVVGGGAMVTLTLDETHTFGVDVLYHCDETDATAYEITGTVGYIAFTDDVRLDNATVTVVGTRTGSGNESSIAWSGTLQGHGTFHGAPVSVALALGGGSASFQVSFLSAEYGDGVVTMDGSFGATFPCPNDPSTPSGTGSLNAMVKVGPSDDQRDLFFSGAASYYCDLTASHAITASVAADMTADPLVLFGAVKLTTLAGSLNIARDDNGTLSDFSGALSATGGLATSWADPNSQFSVSLTFQSPEGITEASLAYSDTYTVGSSTISVSANLQWPCAGTQSGSITANIPLPDNAVLDVSGAATYFCAGSRVANKTWDVQATVAGGFTLFGMVVPPETSIDVHVVGYDHGQGLEWSTRIVVALPEATLNAKYGLTAAGTILLEYDPANGGEPLASLLATVSYDDAPLTFTGTLEGDISGSGLALKGSGALTLAGNGAGFGGLSVDVLLAKDVDNNLDLLGVMNQLVVNDVTITNVNIHAKRYGGNWTCLVSGAVNYQGLDFTGEVLFAGGVVESFTLTAAYHSKHVDIDGSIMYQATCAGGNRWTGNAAVTLRDLPGGVSDLTGSLDMAMDCNSPANWAVSGSLGAGFDFVVGDKTVTVDTGVTLTVTGGKRKSIAVGGEFVWGATTLSAKVTAVLTQSHTLQGFLVEAEIADLDLQQLANDVSLGLTNSPLDSYSNDLIDMNDILNLQLSSVRASFANKAAVDWRPHDSRATAAASVTANGMLWGSPVSISIYGASIAGAWGVAIAVEFGTLPQTGPLASYSSQSGALGCYLALSSKSMMMPKPSLAEPALGQAILRHDGLMRTRQGVSFGIAMDLSQTSAAGYPQAIRDNFGSTGFSGACADLLGYFVSIETVLFGSVGTGGDMSLSAQLEFPTQGPYVIGKEGEFIMTALGVMVGFTPPSTVRVGLYLGMDVWAGEGAHQKTLHMLGGGQLTYSGPSVGLNLGFAITNDDPWTNPFGVGSDVSILLPMAVRTGMNLLPSPPFIAPTRMDVTAGLAIGATSGSFTMLANIKAPHKSGFEFEFTSVSVNPSDFIQDMVGASWGSHVPSEFTSLSFDRLYCRYNPGLVPLDMLAMDGMTVLKTLDTGLELTIENFALFGGTVSAPIISVKLSPTEVLIDVDIDVINTNGLAVTSMSDPAVGPSFYLHFDSSEQLIQATGKVVFAGQSVGVEVDISAECQYMAGQVDIWGVNTQAQWLSITSSGCTRTLPHLPANPSIGGHFYAAVVNSGLVNSVVSHFQALLDPKGVLISNAISALNTVESLMDDAEDLLTDLIWFWPGNTLQDKIDNYEASVDALEASYDYALQQYYYYNGKCVCYWYGCYSAYNCGLKAWWYTEKGARWNLWQADLLVWQGAQYLIGEWNDAKAAVTAAANTLAQHQLYASAFPGMLSSNGQTSAGGITVHYLKALGSFTAAPSISMSYSVSLTMWGSTINPTFNVGADFSSLTHMINQVKTEVNDHVNGFAARMANPGAWRRRRRQLTPGSCPALASEAARTLSVTVDTSALSFTDFAACVPSLGDARRMLFTVPSGAPSVATWMGGSCPSALPLPANLTSLSLSGAALPAPLLDCFVSALAASTSASSLQSLNLGGNAGLTAATAAIVASSFPSLTKLVLTRTPVQCADALSAARVLAQLRHLSTLLLSGSGIGAGGADRMPAVAAHDVQMALLLDQSATALLPSCSSAAATSGAGCVLTTASANQLASVRAAIASAATSQQCRSTVSAADVAVLRVQGASSGSQALLTVRLSGLKPQSVECVRRAVSDVRSLRSAAGTTLVSAADVRAQVRCPGGRVGSACSYFCLAGWTDMARLAPATAQSTPDAALAAQLPSCRVPTACGMTNNGVCARRAGDALANCSAFLHGSSTKARCVAALADMKASCASAALGAHGATCAAEVATGFQPLLGALPPLRPLLARGMLSTTASRSLPLHLDGRGSSDPLDPLQSVAPRMAWACRAVGGSAVSVLQKTAASPAESTGAAFLPTDFPPAAHGGTLPPYNRSRVAYSASCGLTAAAVHAMDLATATNARTLRLPAFAFQSVGVYEFALGMWKDGRFAADSLLVHVVAEALPTPRVSTPALHNPARRLVMHGKLAWPQELGSCMATAAQSSATATWSNVAANSSGSSSTTALHMLPATAGKVCRAHGVTTWVLKAGSLAPGATYKMQYSVPFRASGVQVPVSALVAVAVSTPPSPGAIAVQPSRGAALLQPFRVSFSGFSAAAGSDATVLFELLRKNPTTNVLTVVAPPTTARNVTVYLPAGSHTLVVRALGEGGAATEAETSVVVSALPSTWLAHHDDAIRRITKLLSAGDSTATVSLLAAVAASIADGGSSAADAAAVSHVTKALVGALQVVLAGVRDDMPYALAGDHAAVTALAQVLASVTAVRVADQPSRAALMRLLDGVAAMMATPGAELSGDDALAMLHALDNTLSALPTASDDDAGGSGGARRLLEQGMAMSVGGPVSRRLAGKQTSSLFSHAWMLADEVAAAQLRAQTCADDLQQRVVGGVAVRSAVMCTAREVQAFSPRVALHADLLRRISSTCSGLRLTTLAHASLPQDSPSSLPSGARIGSDVLSFAVSSVAPAASMGAQQVVRDLQGDAAGTSDVSLSFTLEQGKLAAAGSGAHAQCAVYDEARTAWDTRSCSTCVGGACSVRGHSMPAALGESEVSCRCQASAVLGRAATVLLSTPPATAAGVKSDATATTVTVVAAVSVLVIGMVVLVVQGRRANSSSGDKTNKAQDEAADDIESPRAKARSPPLTPASPLSPREDQPFMRRRQAMPERAVPTLSAPPSKAPAAAAVTPVGDGTE